MMCDYVFLGEEIYAAAAQVSEDPIMISGILIEEVGKFFVYILLIVGTLLAAVGLDVAALLSL